MRVISAPYIAPDIAPYISPATGKIINSRPQMEDDLSRSGHIMKEPGIEKDIARNKEYQKERSFAPIAASVDETVRNLVNNGQIQG